MKLPNCKFPCKDCPYRKDSQEGWIKRMDELVEASSFVCHKNNNLQCAGHMLLLGEKNDFVRLAANMNIDTGLRGRELIFDTIEDCVNHHIK